MKSLLVYGQALTSTCRAALAAQRIGAVHAAAHTVVYMDPHIVARTAAPVRRRGRSLPEHHIPDGKVVGLCVSDAERELDVGIVLLQENFD